ncbi:hypothetical protein [Mesorhizobium sp. ES1-4]|uniref:hypothetical protein n=1 Tax=Mesorhizobium sp. ES1-4 TaxID=2876627 RepID=UPI001CCA48F0|nr:hypothetical protein [Mesorhizobium sp. ES1-4]MBZ9798913.1 hypothetical protein [Mesorhizobium sp. ES1-4]
MAPVEPVAPVLPVGPIFVPADEVFTAKTPLLLTASAPAIVTVPIPEAGTVKLPAGTWSKSRLFELLAELGTSAVIVYVVDTPVDGTFIINETVLKGEMASDGREKLATIAPAELVT